MHEQNKKQLFDKMSKKHELTNVSEVEEHISLKYEIKKRLGKGVSDFLFLILLDLIEMKVNLPHNKTPYCTFDMNSIYTSFENLNLNSYLPLT